MIFRITVRRLRTFSSCQVFGVVPGATTIPVHTPSDNPHPCTYSNPAFGCTTGDPFNDLDTTNKLPHPILKPSILYLRRLFEPKH